QKGSEGRGRGVKEKSIDKNKTNTAGSGLFTASDGTLNEVTLVSVVMEGVTPSVIDMDAEKEKLCSLEDTTVLGSFPPLPTQVTTSASNAPGKSSYANVTGKPSGEKLNICTSFTPRGNGIDVVVPVESIRAISKRFAYTTYGFFLEKQVAYPVVAKYIRNTWGKYELVRSMVKLYGVPVTAFSDDDLSVIATQLGTPLMLDSYTSDMYMQSWGRSSYARVMIELRADVKLKDIIVVVMPKVTEEGHYICNVSVEYEWKPPSVPVGPKMGFKPQKEYRHVPKKPTASYNGNKKKGVEPTTEVSNSNSFEVLNTVDNDKELGTNKGTTNLVNNRATSSGSSFMNVNNSSIGTTPIIDKIGKFEELLTNGQAILVDEAGNSLKKVEFLGDYDSDNEVA
ncbi:hypothetical protein Tco_0934582, partial [Tanacetum coccineum]